MTDPTVRLPGPTGRLRATGGVENLRMSAAQPVEDDAELPVFPDAPEWVEEWLLTLPAIPQDGYFWRLTYEHQVVEGQKMLMAHAAAERVTE